MHRALELAARGLWLTSPNPRVGCVITAPDGTVLGIVTENHARRRYLEEVEAAQRRLVGA